MFSQRETKIGLTAVTCRWGHTRTATGCGAARHPQKSSWTTFIHAVTLPLWVSLQQHLGGCCRRGNVGKATHYSSMAMLYQFLHVNPNTACLLHKQKQLCKFWLIFINQDWIIVTVKTFSRLADTGSAYGLTPTSHLFFPYWSKATVKNPLLYLKYSDYYKMLILTWPL